MRGKNSENDTRVTGGSLKWMLACRRLARELPEDVMDRWMDHFELSQVSDGKAVVAYFGSVSPDEFTDKYYEKVADSLSWALGEQVSVEFKRASGRKTGEKKKRRKRKRKKEKNAFGIKIKRIAVQTACGILGMILICGAVAAVTFFWNINQNKNFKETFYQLGSAKINGNLRIIQISDLHNSVFGDNNDILVDRITKLKPDIIVLTGDIIDKDDLTMEVTLKLCRQLTQVAPVCYIYGNNEIEKLVSKRISRREYDVIFKDEAGNMLAEPIKEDDLSVMLEAMGVYVLWNESVTIEAGDKIVDVYGVFTSFPSTFWDYATESFDSFIHYDNGAHFKLMAAHEPHIYETYPGEWADLVLCGHTHGGEARLPWFGGVYGKEHGWFPELLSSETAYISGEYRIGGMPLIVSNGLTNRDLFRINNQPELIIIDINRY